MKRPQSLASLALALVAAAAALGAAPAGATFPGGNGRIVFKRYLDTRRTTSAIFVIRPNGRGARRLTHPARGVQDDQPDWSPDGRRITFERCARGCEVWVVNADGTGAARLGPECLPPEACETRFSPAFSPDGTRIAFGRAFGNFNGAGSEHSEADVMNADGSGVQTLLSFAPYAISGGSAAWAPDGQHLVLELFNSSFGTPPNTLALYIVGLDGSGLRQLTPSSLAGGDHPDWSPDGTRILFRSHAKGNPGPGSQMYTVRPDGTGLKRLTHFRHSRTVLSSSFSPDGKSITVALNGTRGRPDIYVLRADGSALRPVTRTPLWDSAPDWGPAP